MSLSELSKEILKMDYKQRQLKYVELILSHKIFNWALKQRFESGSILTKARDNPTDITLTAGGRWIQIDIEGDYSDYYRADVKCNNNL